MRHLRQLCYAFALACLLAPAALADDGIMHPEIIPPPVAVAGIMHPEDPVSAPQAADAALEIVLNLINLLGGV